MKDGDLCFNTYTLLKKTRIQLSRYGPLPVHPVLQNVVTKK